MQGVRRRFVLVVQCVDLLTRRLYDRDPELLEARLVGGGDEVHCVPFHRNFLETAALSITANGGAINWAALRALLDPNGGAELDAVRATRVVSRKEVAQQRRLSFHELSQRCTDECARVFKAGVISLNKPVPRQGMISSSSRFLLDTAGLMNQGRNLNLCEPTLRVTPPHFF